MAEEYFWFGFHVDEGSLVIGLECLFIDLCRVSIFIGEFLTGYTLIELILPEPPAQNAIEIVASWIQTYITNIKAILILWTLASNLSTWSMIFGNLNKRSLLCWPFILMSAISVCIISSLIIGLLCVALHNFSRLHIGLTFIVTISMLILADLNSFLFFKTINRSRLSLNRQLKKND